MSYWRLQVQSSLQVSNNIGILNTCTRLWLTESEQATPIVSIKNVVRSSVKVPELDKHLKKAGGYIDRNAIKIDIQLNKPNQTKLNLFRRRMGRYQGLGRARLVCFLDLMIYSVYHIRYTYPSLILSNLKNYSHILLNTSFFFGGGLRSFSWCLLSFFFKGRFSFFFFFWVSFFFFLL